MKRKSRAKYIGWGVFALIVLYFVIVGVQLSKSFTYTFRQERSNIEKVEICSYDHYAGTREPLVELSDDDTDAILADISALECREFFPLDPILSYGDVVICISYQNGEVEMIGIYNIGFFTAEGELKTTKKWFEIEDMRCLIAKYVDMEVLEEVSEEF